MQRLTTIILAAGYGKRMKSKLPKVLHKVSGLPMIQHVVDLSKAIESDQIICVVGHGRALVENALASQALKFAVQEQQLGTGHAVLSAEEYLQSGEVLVLFGDAPLLSETTLREFIAYHKENGHKASLISTNFEDPTGYGRIIRTDSGAFSKIVEHKDATFEERLIREVNSGIGLFDAKALKDALKSLRNDNVQGEYYLTDVFEIIKGLGCSIGAYLIDSPYEVMGINDRVALAEAEHYYQKRIKENLMLSGVTLVNPESIYIEKNVTVGCDTVILQGSRLLGDTHIGEECIIGPYAEISDTKINSQVHIHHSTVNASEIDSFSTVGPYAYLRPKSIVGKHVKIGDFVEVKNTVIADGVKISHLTYVGDGKIGENVNLGCGVVFVNYDGNQKHLTEIEAGAFIGCNTNLIAPVKVGKNAYVAAGSTITENVPENALAIARERQVNKTEWSNKYQKNK